MSTPLLALTMILALVVLFVGVIILPLWVLAEPFQTKDERRGIFAILTVLTAPIFPLYYALALSKSRAMKKTAVFVLVGALVVAFLLSRAGIQWETLLREAKI